MTQFRRRIFKINNVRIAGVVNIIDEAIASFDCEEESLLLAIQPLDRDTFNLKCFDQYFEYEYPTILKTNHFFHEDPCHAPSTDYKIITPENWRSPFIARALTVEMINDRFSLSNQMEDE
jgi:hypothetical protein